MSYLYSYSYGSAVSGETAAAANTEGGLVFILILIPQLWKRFFRGVFNLSSGELSRFVLLIL